MKKTKIKGLPTREIRKDAKPFATGVSKEQMSQMSEKQRKFIQVWG